MPSLDSLESTKISSPYNGNNFYIRKNLRILKFPQITETLTKILSHSTMFSIYYDIFYGRIYHDVREKYISQTEKNQKKTPCLRR